MISINY
jgi:hypothetical protein